MSHDAIRALVESNPGQATFEEYALARDVVAAAAPCRLLVFGVGGDSSLWVETNAGGRTAFVEDAGDWARRIAPSIPQAEIHLVRYRTVLALWPLLRRFESWLFMGHLAADLGETSWDVVFVDGPRGTRWYRPGRMRSIYTAAALSGALAPTSRGGPDRRSGGVLEGRRDHGPEASHRTVDVLVHDCHRKVELECCHRFLGRARLVRQVGSMRHYRVG